MRAAPNAISGRVAGIPTVLRIIILRLIYGTPWTSVSAAHETATRYSAWCVSQSDLRLLGSRTNLGGYTHDPTHVTRVHDPIRRLMGADYVIRGHRVAVSDICVGDAGTRRLDGAVT